MIRFVFLPQLPLVTDRNPHMEGLLDQHRIIYLPYTEDRNVFMELPSFHNLFFTTQRVKIGGEVYVIRDDNMRKTWVLAVHQVYATKQVSTQKIHH